jgi:hypothetical protein
MGVNTVGQNHELLLQELRLGVMSAARTMRVTLDHEASVVGKLTNTEREQKHLNPTSTMLEYSTKVRTCIMRGCLGQGHNEPLLGLSYDGSHYVYMAFPGWLMCDYHRDQVDISDLLDGNVWGKNGTAFDLVKQSFKNRNLHVPLRELTLIKWREA